MSWLVLLILFIAAVIILLGRFFFNEKENYILSDSHSGELGMVKVLICWVSESLNK
jgi:uncharacterized membrane protein